MAKYCIRCGVPILEGEGQYCTGCRSRFGIEEKEEDVKTLAKYCWRCGMPILDVDKKCTHCGAEIR